MNTNQDYINTKAHQLARRYKNPQMYEDLKQEALLVGYALLSEGTTDEGKIGSAMRSRLHDFYNFSRMPVYLPASGYSRRARVALLGGGSSQNVEWPLLCALLASDGGDMLEEGQIHGNADHVADYEYNDYLQHLMFIMEECLDNREYFVVTSVFLHEVEQQVVADDLGITQQRVAQVIDTALEKIRKELV
jgi:hypothetical protein